MRNCKYNSRFWFNRRWYYCPTRTLNVGAGTGITVNADDIAVNMGAFDTDNLF